MCEWSAEDLLDAWHRRSGGRLEELGFVARVRALEDGSQAAIELRAAKVTASVTAWSTGMLELTTLVARPGLAAPDVVTEQRQTEVHAAALLDTWTGDLCALEAT